MRLNASLYAVALMPLGISVCIAGAVQFARALLRRRVRPAVLLCCEQRAYEILDIFSMSALSVDECATADYGCEGESFVFVLMNSNGGGPLPVRTLVFDHYGLNLPLVFDVFCGLLTNIHPDCLLVCDCWNCLMVLIGYNLKTLLKETGDNAFLLSEAKAEEVLTLCTLLRGKYSIFHYPLLDQYGVQVEEFPEATFQRTAAMYNSKRSLRHSVASFLELVRDSCSIPRIMCLAAISFLTPDMVLRSFIGLHMFINWRPIYAAEIGKTLGGNSPTQASPLQFIREQVAGTPGRLVLMAIISTMSYELLYCAHNLASRYLFADVIRSLYTDAYIALATADYDASDEWALPSRVSQALWQASNSVMNELQNRMHSLFDALRVCRTTVRFPMVALATWLGSQWSSFAYFISESFYMECQYAKSQFASAAGVISASCANTCDNGLEFPELLPTGGRMPLPSPLSLLKKGGGKGMHSPFFQRGSLVDGVERRAAHYGLTLLSVINLESGNSPCYTSDCLLQHVMWPAGDSLFTNYLLGSLKTVGWRGPSASLGIQRLGWLSRVIEELSATKCISSNSLHLRYRRDCISGFALLRLGGLDLTAAAVISSPTTLSSRNDWRENCVRDILHGFFQTADAVPSLLTAVAALSVSPAFFKQPLLDQAEYMSQLQSMQNCFPLTHTSIGSFYEESGMSEAQVDEANFRRILASGGSSLGSYQVLQGVQVVQHSIDRPMLSSFYPLDAPWSVEFRDVSFRYSERHPYVLRHVSFFVDRGQFFGITGYSGAGKTTILRLLNRTYAPTKGDIFINGVSVGKYPARMLRRGIANVWQEENGMRLFEGLSIATNVALGNLGASTENNVISALSASQSLSFVQNRSLGIHTPLRTDELSGGEVERLCIARAFMKYHSNAGLCTFDEPTSAVDAVTEEMIYNSLQLRGKESKIRTSTIIVAAHRLATLRDADKIIVLNEGSVAECGTWVELRRKGTQSYFSKMLDSQLVLFSMT